MWMFLGCFFFKHLRSVDSASMLTLDVNMPLYYVLPKCSSTHGLDSSEVTINSVVNNEFKRKGRKKLAKISFLPVVYLEVKKSTQIQKQTVLVSMYRIFVVHAH